VPSEELDRAHWPLVAEVPFHSIVVVAERVASSGWERRADSVYWHWAVNLLPI
jgi:hypothetical protein